MSQRMEQDAGCSVMSWSTEDGKQLFGRNFDLNRISERTKVMYVPKDYIYYTAGTKGEGNRREETRHTANYATLGMGLMMEENAPVLYEGINEYGLMGAQLNYREFAFYETEIKAGRMPVHPAFLVYHILAQCRKLEQIREKMQEEITLFGIAMAGLVPTLHWMFSDGKGESLVIESDKDGLKLYRNTIGILTNAPGYEWHKWNLYNYCFIRQKDYESLEIEHTQIPLYSSGSGGLGLPGDWSSPSRFVRLAYMKKYAKKGSTEELGVVRLFRLLSNVALPLGMIEEEGLGKISPIETKRIPYDYTIYSSVMCAQSLRYYWQTYDDMKIHCVSLSEWMEKEEICQMNISENEILR